MVTDENIAMKAHTLGWLLHSHSRKIWILQPSQTETLYLCPLPTSTRLSHCAMYHSSPWFFSLGVCPSNKSPFTVFTCHLCSNNIQFQFSQNIVNWAWWYAPITPALWRQRWEDQKSKIILSHRVNSGPVEIHETLSQNKTRQQINKQKLLRFFFS